GRRPRWWWGTWRRRSPLMEDSRMSLTKCRHLPMKRPPMTRTKQVIEPGHGAHLFELAACAIVLIACFPLRSMAQQPGQKTFSSPEEASNALVTAVQGNDEK